MKTMRWSRAIRYEISTDANNLTKSGSITPAVDFEHLSTVLIITDLKQQVSSDDLNSAE